MLLLALFSTVQVDAQPSAARGGPSQDLREDGVGKTIEPNVLGSWPLCEASAAQIAPWDTALVLVADNELDQQLFGFSLQGGRLVPLQGGRLVPRMTLEMPGGKRPRDIEALVQVASSLLVVGSHSRSSCCKERSNRQRLRLLESDASGSLQSLRLIDSKKVWSKARASQAACVTTLFTDPSPNLAEATCGALIMAEKIALEGSSCPVLNIEGAFGTDGGRVWLGLRAPLADGRAILLRLTSALDALRFDRVAFLDLEGRGIRELALEGETIHGIAGPVEDSSDPFALFSVDVDKVRTGGTLQPEILRRDLPTSSEGMVVVDGGILIAVDGAEGGEGEMECALPSRQYRIELP